MPVFGDGKNFQFLVQSFTPAWEGEEGGGEGEEGEGRGEGGVDGGEGGVGGVGGGGEHERVGGRCDWAEYVCFCGTVNLGPEAEAPPPGTCCSRCRRCTDESGHEACLPTPLCSPVHLLHLGHLLQQLGRVEIE